MKTHDQEILILYDASSSAAKRTLAYAHTLSNHVKEWEYRKHPLTTTLWKQVLFSLNVRPKDLLNRADPYYQKYIRDRSFDEEGWLNILRKNTYLIKAPIAIKGRKAVLCTDPSRIFSLLQETVEEGGLA